MELPIEREIPGLLQTLSGHQAVVLEAPPGAGKTTAVPLALMHAGIASGGRIAVSEPRRLAAKLAAHFVAGQLGEEPGERVGYQVRFESRVGPKTCISYQTAGVLLKQLLHTQGPLPGVVILDEFHERQLENDQLLALLQGHLQRRPELRLIVMSATLDAEPIATLLGAPRIRSEGKAFPLRIEHYQEADTRPLESQISSAVKRALAEQAEGHVLVFLPTVRDIQRAQEKLRALRENHDIDVLPLHGELHLNEQARAVAPSSRRKVVLSTNVAESSITVPGVTAVIDSGLARTAYDSPWSGRRELKVQEISRASAIQRAGRAGRTAPGVAYRLFTEANLRARREQEVPELQRSDLSAAWLELIAAGITNPAELPWLDSPPEPAIDAARTLLRSLGAVDREGVLTGTGRRMLRFPVHPRLGRCIVAGEDLGVSDDAVLAAALLSERDIVRRGSEPHDAAADSDVLDRCDRFREAQDSHFAEHTLRRLDLQRGPVQSVASAYRQLRRLTHSRAEPASDPDQALCRALLTGFPDRVARRRANGADLVLVNGTVARLSSSSCVHRAQLLLAHDVEYRVDRQGRSDLPQVSWATRIEPDWLLDFPDPLQETDELQWNPEKQQVEAVSSLRYGSVLLDESRKRAEPSERCSQVLARAALASKARFLGKSNTLETFFNRLTLLRTQRPDLDLPEIGSDEAELFLEACRDLTSFHELESLDWSALMLTRLGSDARRALERELPHSIRLPSGRELQVSYERDKPPWVKSRLQDFFGMQQSPTLCNGKLPLTLHLLAPNQRAVQVTSDLVGFWQRHYPELRRQLMRRYPKHSWPEDPTSAQPPRPRR